jgi:hypothetical protein
MKKHVITFAEFLNESMSPSYSGKPIDDKLSDGTKIRIYRNNQLEDDGEDPLGVKTNFVENLITWNGDKTTKYILYKILTGPNKDSLLFCERLIWKVRTPKGNEKYRDSSENWYSENPKTYSFKDVKIDARKIPPILKTIYDEFVEILNKY